MAFWPISYAELLLGKSFLVLKAEKTVVLLLGVLRSKCDVMAGVTAAILLPS